MKKRVHKLSLNRETVRDLSRDALDQVAGGVPTAAGSCWNSCGETIPQSVCESCKLFCE